MLPITVSVQLAAASATAVSLAQTLGAAGNFLINGASASGGVATFAQPRRVLLTFAADETGHNFTITGTGHGGQAVTETVAGTTMGTVDTYNDFGTVTKVSSSAATTGNVSVGTNGVGSSRWVYTSPHMTPFALSVACVVVPTANYTVEYAYSDPAGYAWSYPAAAVNVTVFPDATVASKTDNEVATMNDPVTCWRVTVNSGTGTVSATGLQAGISGP